MHEASLARQILAVVLERAGREGATRVRLVRGWVSDTEAISADSLALHFAAGARGTVAEGAEVELALERARVRCLSCVLVYEPDHHLLLCPACGGERAEIVGRVGLGVDAIEVE
jgi:hydrogenase nickel incorporation protein HypA/HybF